MKRKLYLLTTIGCGNYYVIALNPIDAESKLIKALDKADYNFSNKRTVENIQLLANEISNFPGDQPNFSVDENIIFID